MATFEVCRADTTYTDRLPRGRGSRPARGGAGAGSHGGGGAGVHRYLVRCLPDQRCIHAEEDRRHPVKRLRPVVSGEVPARLAGSVGVLLAALGVLIGLSGGVLLFAHMP